MSVSLSVKRGGQISEVLTFSAQGGFSAAIALSCSVVGAAPAPTCGVSPNSVTPGANATLTMDASRLSAATFPLLPLQMANVHALCLALVALAFVLTAAFDQQRRRAWLLTSTLLVLSVFPAACGSASSRPVAQNFTVTVTATSGAIKHLTTINVTVN